MFKPSDLPTLHRMQEAATRVAALVHARAVREYGLAFGNPNATGLDCCIIHNSLVGRDTGRPWPEVNYDHMRRAQWLLEQQHVANSLVNQWYQRKCRAVR